MRSALALAARLFVVGFGACIACGSDEGEPGPTHGTCDLRSVDFHCIERTSTPTALEEQKQGCIDNAGSWSNDPCPTTDDLVGCCDYVLGDEFRECFYVGTTRNGEEYCAMPVFEGTGVWTPAN